MIETRLNNGVSMPLFGLGMFQMSDADECARIGVVGQDGGERSVVV